MKFLVIFATFLFAANVAYTNANIIDAVVGGHEVAVVNDNALVDVPLPDYYLNKLLASMYHFLKFGANFAILGLNFFLIIGNNPIFRLITNTVHLLTFPIRVVVNIIMLPCRIIFAPLRFILRIFFDYIPTIIQNMLNKLALLLKPSSLRLFPKLPRVDFAI